MAIPKEPRALMINLMYLVLTAMLALNVSAEIINAFFMIDKGIEATNKIIDGSADGVVESIKNTVEIKKQYEPLLPLAQGVKGVSDDLIKFIDQCRVDITTSPSGERLLYPDDYKEAKKRGLPKNYKDIDITQRTFVEGGKGGELKAKIESTKEAYRTYLMKFTSDPALTGIKEIKVTKEDVDKFIETLPLGVDDVSWKDSGKPTWEAFTFGYMPVAAVYPLLRKFQNDAKVSASMVVNFISDKIGKKELPPDKFAVFSQAKKGYLLVGETYEAMIGLGSYSSKADFNVSVSAGGSAVKQDNGMFKYTATASSIGTKKYTATITVTNPLTGQKESFNEEFSYEVGQPSLAISLDKMNVFYIGVENPVTIAAAGISSNDVAVSLAGGGGSITKASGSSYVVKVAQQGDVTLTVRDTKSGKSFPFKYRAKKIPNPVVKLAGKVSGQLGSGEMKVQRGLFPELENFDFEAKCDIQSYELVYSPRRGDPKIAQGAGAAFPGNVTSLLQEAKPGDAYLFMNVKVRCPGDPVAREVPGLSFTIK